MSADTCPSCGIAYRDHLGLIGTCAKVLALRAEVASMEHLLAEQQRAFALALAAQQAETDRLRNVLLVERGDGVPPDGGWTAKRSPIFGGGGEIVSTHVMWSKDDGSACPPWSTHLHWAKVSPLLTMPGWSWRRGDCGDITEGDAPTAYEAMEAANTAIGGDG